MTKKMASKNKIKKTANAKKDANKDASVKALKGTFSKAELKATFGEKSKKQSKTLSKTPSKNQSMKPSKNQSMNPSKKILAEKKGLKVSSSSRTKGLKRGHVKSSLPRKSSSMAAVSSKFSKQIKRSKNMTRRLLQTEGIDKILLKMAQSPYNRIINQFESGKKRLDEERRLALEIGFKILNKAKKVRDSLINTNKPSRK